MGLMGKIHPLLLLVRSVNVPPISSEPRPQHLRCYSKELFFSHCHDILSATCIALFFTNPYLCLKQAVHHSSSDTFSFPYLVVFRCSLLALLFFLLFSASAKTGGQVMKKKEVHRSEVVDRNGKGSSTVKQA